MSSAFSRRSMLKSGVTGASAALTAGMIGSAEGFAVEDYKYIKQPVFKKTDQPTIVALMGQHCHNPIFMELNFRATLSKMNWRILFTQYSEFFTRELIEIADVAVTLIGNTEYNRASVGYVPYGVVENRPPQHRFMTDEQDQAIHDNVQKRGMGYLCLHNSIYRPRPLMKKMMEFDWAMHPPVQNVQYRNFNPEHPI